MIDISIPPTPLQAKVEEIGKRLITFEAPDKFRVSFPYDEEIIDDMHKIPGRVNDNQDAVWLVPATSARHLIAFATFHAFTYPPDLDQAARLLANYDTLEVCPLSSKCVDYNAPIGREPVIVIRTPERGTHVQGDLIRRVMKFGSVLGAWGWNPKAKYWEIPPGVARAKAESFRELRDEHGFYITVPAAKILNI